MDKLRLKFIRKGYSIKLTQEENEPSGRFVVYTYQNSSWLMNSRGVLDFTHPHYPGPFTKKNTFNYHLYCTLEMWKALGNQPEDHWDCQTSKLQKDFCWLYLPIVQRKKTWKVSKLGPEIFDDLMPS